MEIIKLWYINTRVIYILYFQLPTVAWNQSINAEEGLLLLTVVPQQTNVKWVKGIVTQIQIVMTAWNAGQKIAIIRWDIIIHMTAATRLQVIFRRKKILLFKNYTENVSD